MGRYRKLPAEVEAERLTMDNPDEICDWIRKEGGECHRVGGVDAILIHTLEGNMLAEVGDWVIRGVKGEFYPCKPDIFQQTYAPVFADGS